MSVAPVLEAPPHPGVRLARKKLLAALEQAAAVVPGRSCKPIYTAVRLECPPEGPLEIRATDGEIMFQAAVDAAGVLAGCVVPCHELIRRLRASRETDTVLCVRNAGKRLIVNGGRVEHALHTLPLDEFAPALGFAASARLTFPASVLRSAIGVTKLAMARDASRYAISGLLLEADSAGIRLVGTDGRRLVVAELGGAQKSFEGRIILPARFVKLIEKFSPADDSVIEVAVKNNVSDKGEKLSSDVEVTAPDWILTCRELEGTFPLYREVMPKSESRFACDKALMVETLKQVMLATSDTARAVGLSLRARSLELSASSPETGSATAKLPARFLGGSDKLIHTGFNPDYLLEAVQTVPGERAVIDVGQNGYANDQTVYGKPAIVIADGNDSVRWVLMPLNMGYPATQEYLGSNYKPELAGGS
jgi:DNA polymerase III subunit beta